MTQMTTCDLHNETIINLQHEVKRLQAENAKLKMHAEAMAVNIVEESGWEGLAEYMAYRADFPKEPDK